METGEIRRTVMFSRWAFKAPQEVAQEFDAWLAEQLAHAKAEGHREGYATAREDMISGAFIGGPTYEALKASFTGQKIFKEGQAAEALRRLQEREEES